MGDDNFEGVQFLDDVDLFGDDTQPGDGGSGEQTTPPQGNQEDPENIEKNEPTEVVVDENDSLFGDDDEPQQPESVGEEKNNKAGEGAGTTDNGDSPTGQNAYSSFAKALQGDRLFQFLDDEVIDNVKDADSFADAFEQEIEARLDDATRRFRKATEAGVPDDTAGQYENIIQRLESITEEQLSEETEQASRLRQNILYQDFLNRGYKEERAKQLVKRAVDGGTDIEDAKDALESNKQFYQDEYNKLIEDSKKEADAERQRVRKEAQEFRKAVLEKEKIFGDVQVDKATRQKAFDAMTRIVGKNAGGDPVTAVQKFADENPVEFRSVLGIMWAMTDGFKELGNVLKQDINKKVRSNLKEVENRIKGSAPRGGSPKFIGGDEGSSHSSQGWMLDV